MGAILETLISATLAVAKAVTDKSAEAEAAALAALDRVIAETTVVVSALRAKIDANKAEALADLSKKFDGK